MFQITNTLDKYSSEWRGYKKVSVCLDGGFRKCSVEGLIFFFKLQIPKCLIFKKSFYNVRNFKKKSVLPKKKVSSSFHSCHKPSI